MTSADKPTITYDVGGYLLERPFRAGRLGHFGLYVNDLQASVEFYAGILGFRVTDHLLGPDAAKRGVFLTYNSDHHALVLIDAGVARQRGALTVDNQLSFQVSTLREVVEGNDFFRLHNLDVWRVGRDTPGSNWAVYVYDPDGHRVELFYGMEQIGWDRLSKPGASARPVDAIAVPRLGEEAEVQAMIDAGVETSSGHRWSDCGDARFDVGGVLLPRPFKVIAGGPIDLFVDDVDRSTEFYCSIMGFAITHEESVGGRRVVYLRTGTEHHCLTLAHTALRETIQHGTPSSLLAIGLQLGGYRQLRDARAYLAAAGHPTFEMPPELRRGLGRTVCCVDPDGNRIQLYDQIEQLAAGVAPPPLSQEEGEVWHDVVPFVGPGPNPAFQGPIG